LSVWQEFRWAWRDHTRAAPFRHLGRPQPASSCAICPTCLRYCAPSHARRVGRLVVPRKILLDTFAVPTLLATPL